VLSAKLLRNFFVVVPTAAWMVAVYFIVAASLDPDYYFRYATEEPWTLVYPTGSVARVIAVTSAEMIAFFAIVRPWRRPLSVLRLVLAFALLSAWSALLVPFVVHMPGYVLVHHVWLASLTGFVGIVLAMTAVGRSFRGSPAKR